MGKTMLEQARAEILKTFLLPPETLQKLWPTQLEMIQGTAVRQITITATGLAIRRIKTN
ncbi:hypothetical protein [Mesorhizobium jarvisii]|uniref:hypothetical protein n=1 Tax=Mesorhizobium jarvisii TaxID=1777867 RepID=UPI000A9DD1F6|nr:hypothetical protein [Mesorhizobium jarvisii]